MASKFHGEFEVSADFVSEYVYEGVVAGDWLIIGKLSKGGFVALYTADDSREYAYLNLRYLLHSDLDFGIFYDYEIWHVVATPGWMPTDGAVDVVSVTWCDHMEHSDFGETLLHLDIAQLPDGLSVLVTDWGMYALKDWQTCQPRSIAALGECECDEIQHDSGIPCALLECFVDFGYNCVLRAGRKWSDLNGMSFQIRA